MTKIRIAITANRNLTRADEAMIGATMLGLVRMPDVEEIIFGGARGGDTVALIAAGGGSRSGKGTRIVRPKCVVIVPCRVADQPHDAREAIRVFADEVVELGLPITRDDGFAAYKRRNEAMADRGTHLGSFWNGDYKSGTWNCISYARRIGRPWWNNAVDGGDR